MAQQVKHLFIVTSAVNSKFGVFSPEQRLQQTLDTITSIRNKIPTARIVIMECCGTPITDTQADQLRAVSDHFRDMSRDADVQACTITTTGTWSKTVQKSCVLVVC